MDLGDVMRKNIWLIAVSPQYEKHLPTYAS